MKHHTSIRSCFKIWKPIWTFPFLYNSCNGFAPICSFNVVEKYRPRDIWLLSLRKCPKSTRLSCTGLFPGFNSFNRIIFFNDLVFGIAMKYLRQFNNMEYNKRRRTTILPGYFHALWLYNIVMILFWRTVKSSRPAY